MANPASAKAPKCCECCDERPLSLNVVFSPSGSCWFSGSVVLENATNSHSWHINGSGPGGDFHGWITCSDCDPGYDFYCHIGAEGCEGGTTLEVVSCDPLQLEGTLILTPVGQGANCCETITIVATEVDA